MVALRIKMGMAVLAAAVVCGFGSEAQAQTVWTVNPKTAAAANRFGTYTVYGSGTIRITTTYYVYDLYFGSGTPTATGTIARFVQRDAQSLKPVYGGRCELVAASANIWFATDRKYFGNTPSNYDGPTMRLMLTVP